MKTTVMLLATGEGYSDEMLALLNVAGINVTYRREPSRDELRTLLPEVEAYLLGGSERLDAELLQIASRLRLISFVGTGVGAFVDVRTANDRGIIIRNTPGIMADAVAEHTVGLLLGLVRGLFAQNDSIKRSCTPIQPTRELRELTVGLWGLGSIGSRVARLLVRGFQCSVAYYSRTRKPAMEEELGLRYCPLDNLVTLADAIVMLLPTSSDTINIFDSSRFAAVKEGTFVVNTAGAQLVEPGALRSALVSGRVRAAAFDGYWIEPLPSVGEDPFGLLGLSDGMFVVTPHTAAKTNTAWRRMLEQAIANVVTSIPGDGK